MCSPNFIIFPDNNSPNPNGVLTHKVEQHALNTITAFCPGATKWCMLYLEKLQFTLSG